MTEETLFERLVQTPQAERDGLLEKLTEGHPDLRERLLKLLQAHAAQQSAAIDPTELHQLLAEPENAELDATSDGQRPRTGSSASHKIGSLIAGRYMLRELIAEGGMGAVWLATQDQPVKRKVALKLIKAGMDSRQVIARFEAERQALAMMDHPNIAKVFDGGVTDEGRPFFVMEYVRGIPLTEYCDQARGSVKERLGLFIDVCQAIQHAHQKGIVHRDLKPSNILVCLYDGKPVVKVIDFGLAKAMHQPLTEHSIFTSHGVMVGTPLYMSPEQAEYNNLDVDTRTDIYSLGVILYELLTGTTPLEREQLRTAAYNEVLRLIKEVEPPRPSMRLSKSASLPSIAAQRSVDPKYLSRSLSGDLDWIVMKSLEKDRSRRYESATGLARDVERYLNEEAIEARPPSSTYRLGKYLKKHKLQATAFSLVLLAMIAGSAAAGWGWFTARQAERQVRESLAEVSAERDAKETALAAEEIQRKEAEQQREAAELQREAAESALISGLLRPIGFRTEAETNALIDWQRLPTDELKLRTLKVAFDSPSMIKQLSKSSSEVLLASVGLSTSRRADAIAFLKSCEADPANSDEAKDVARLLLIELGVLDFPVEHLILRNDVSLAIKLRVLNSLESQISKLNPEQLIAIANACIDAAITSPGTDGYDPLGDYNNLLNAIIPKLTLEDRDSIVSRLRGQLQNAVNRNKILVGFYVLSKLQVIVDRDEFELVWERILKPIRDYEERLGKDGNGSNLKRVEAIKTVEESLDLYSVQSMTPHVPDDKVWDVWQYAMNFGVETDSFLDTFSQEEILATLAPRLAPQLVQQAWVDLCDLVLQELGVEYLPNFRPITYLDIFQLLAQRLTLDELHSSWQSAIAINANQSLDHRQLRQLKIDQLCALFPYIVSSENENQLSDALFLELMRIFSTELWHQERATQLTLSEAIAACVPRVSSGIASESFDSFLTSVIDECARNANFRSADTKFETTLVCLKKIANAMPRDWFASKWEQLRIELANKQVQQLSKQLTLLAILVDSIDMEDLREAWVLFAEKYYPVPSSLDNGISVAAATAFCKTICERLEKDELRSIHTQLNIQISDHRDFSDYEKNRVAEPWLQLARLLSHNAHTANEDYLVLVDARIRYSLSGSNGNDEPVYILSHLDRFVDRLSDEQIANLIKAHGREFFLKPSSERLAVAFCKRIEPTARRESVVELLEQEMKASNENKAIAHDLLLLIDDPRSLLQLCFDPSIRRSRVAELLLRLEEIYLYDSRNVFTKKKMSEDEYGNEVLQPTGNWPDRRFTTIYDVAEWIDKNWPDFREEDLWNDEPLSP